MCRLGHHDVTHTSFAGGATTTQSINRTAGKQRKTAKRKPHRHAIICGRDSIGDVRRCRGGYWRNRSRPFRRQNIAGWWGSGSLDHWRRRGCNRFRNGSRASLFTRCGRPAHRRSGRRDNLFSSLFGNGCGLNRLHDRRRRHSGWRADRRSNRGRRRHNRRGGRRRGRHRDNGRRLLCERRSGKENQHSGNRGAGGAERRGKCVFHVTVNPLCAQAFIAPEHLVARMHQDADEPFSRCCHSPLAQTGQRA